MSTIETHDDVKQLVREKYTEIAQQNPAENAASCCGVGGCATIDYAVFAEDYSGTEGYVADADLGLGCGIPTQFAQIRKGETVLDLGSGAGNDAFVARAIVGEDGRVIGVDMTEAMIAKARENCRTLGFQNVEFRLGDIEKLPLGAGMIDLALSNCVLNLVPDKARAFTEIFRVLKVGGRFSISDVVSAGALPPKIAEAAEMYAGCVSGAIPKDEYLGHIIRAGFDDVRVVSEKPILIPDEILARYLSAEEIAAFHAAGNAIMSVTVTGEKRSCCAPGACSPSKE